MPCCVLLDWLGLKQKKQFIKAGNDAFDNYDYYEAIAYYENALKFNGKNEEILYQVAMSYYSLKDYAKAEKYFVKIDQNEAFPLLEFYKGTNYKLLGRYDDAIKHFENFRNLYPIEGYYSEKANQEIASCYWAKDQEVMKDVEIRQFERPLNTPYSDFAASYLDSNIIQVSSLQKVSKNKLSDFQSKLYFYRLEENDIDRSEVTFPLNREDSLDYANGFFLSEKNEFYYSKCYTEHEVGEKICDLYVRKYANGQWDKEVKLNINTAENTETQAHLSINDSGETILYFVSNRSGGKGKLDIWQAKEQSFGVFSDPLNLPIPINTIDNESTPFFNQENGILYFSSEWHYGFGGYDIFSSTKEKNEWSPIKNLGSPINSSANDQYYYPSDYNNALFASNREGAMQLKGSACCYDIFEHLVPEETLDIDSTLLALEELTRNETNLNTIEASFKELQEAIPVTVYFHNDEPNPKSIAVKTSLSYADCFEDYQVVKPLYFEEFNDEIAITNWFETVDTAYAYLNSFLSILSNVLSQKDVTLQIEGYCSPLALNDYNINLAKRRIVNLENYILDWEEGVLQAHYNEGQLKFTATPFGEENAKENVSDSYEDVKQSIYNPKAAIERRVAIIAVF